MLDNKVSLFARVIDLETGESGDMIFNKYDAGVQRSGRPRGAGAAARGAGTAQKA